MFSNKIMDGETIRRRGIYLPLSPNSLASNLLRILPTRHSKQLGGYSKWGRWCS
jgi:hypothetical protein